MAAVGQVILVTPKQVRNYKWHPRSGTVKSLDGKHWRTDRIVYLWGDYSPTGRFHSSAAKVQPWVFFYIGNKNYKVTLFPSDRRVPS